MISSKYQQRVAKIGQADGVTFGGKVHWASKPLSYTQIRKRVYTALECARPGDTLSKVVDLSLMLLIFLNIGAVLAESVETTRIKYDIAFTRFEYFSVFVFSIEYLLRIWACIEKSGTSDQTGNHWLTRLNFVRSIPALIDLVAILPFYLFQFGLLSNIDMRFLRCFRILRAFKLTRYSQSMTLLMLVLKDNARIFATTLYILIVVMLFAASGIYLFERVAQPEDFGSIPAAMWWAFATLTTVGYGDVTPVTVGGKIFGAMITVVSIGIVALPAGILASSFSEQLRLRKDHYRSVAGQALADGIITDEERTELENTRITLGLSENTAQQILAQKNEGILADENSRRIACPHCGEPVEATKTSSRA